MPLMSKHWRLILLAPAAAAAQPKPDPRLADCPGGPVGLLVCAAQRLDIVGDALRSARDSLLRSVTGWVTDTAAWFLRQIGTLLGATNTPDLGAGWWVAKYNLLLALAITVAAATLLLAVLDAAAKGNPAMLGRAVGVDVPVAAVVGALGPAAVTYLVSLADALSDALGQGIAADSARALHSGAEWFLAASSAPPAGGNPAVPLFAAALVALLAIVAALFVLVELLLRANAIYLIAALLPVIYATRIWPAAKPLARKSTEVLVAIIFAKPVVVLAVALGAGAAGSLEGVGDGSLQQFGTALSGAVFLLLAALSPWAILALLPAFEAGIAAAYRQRTALTAGPRTTLQTTYTGAYLHRMATAGSSQAARAALAGIHGQGAPRASNQMQGPIGPPGRDGLDGRDGNPGPPTRGPGSGGSGSPDRGAGWSRQPPRPRGPAA